MASLILELPKLLPILAHVLLLTSDTHPLIVPVHIAIIELDILLGIPILVKVNHDGSHEAFFLSAIFLLPSRQWGKLRFLQRVESWMVVILIMVFIDGIHWQESALI